MVGSGSDVFAVWAYVIAHAKDSAVELNPALIGATIGISREAAAAAIDTLTQPDPDSRNAECEGRRLVREGVFQYRVVSHEHYRTLRSEEERREYNRIKQQEYRDRKRDALPPVNDIGNASAKCTHTEAEAEAEAETNTKTKNKARGAQRFILPSWIDPEAWADYEEMRASIRKKPTDRARALIVSKLEDMRQKGHDPNDALRRSTMSNWTSVFPPNNQQRPATPPPPTIKYTDPEAMNAR
jgi:hypothetical protein